MNGRALRAVKLRESKHMKPSEAAAVAAAVNAALQFVPGDKKELAALRVTDNLNNAALNSRFRVSETEPFAISANVEKQGLV